MLHTRNNLKKKGIDLSTKQKDEILKEFKGLRPPNYDNKRLFCGIRSILAG